MKNSIIIGLLLLSIPLLGQEKVEIIQKEYSFEKPGISNVFQLSNISGSIEVEVHESEVYALTVTKKIMAKTAERLAQGLKETGVGMVDRLDTLIVYFSSPCHTFKKYKKGDNSGYGYVFNNCNLKYEYKLDMKLKVPKDANLILKTVNDGDIKVINVKGNLNVRNVNGAITLEGVSGKIVASTINGDVDVNYDKNPSHNSTFYTLNGDINADFKSGLAAKITFKSFNGNMYTNLPAITTLAGKLTKEQVDNGKGIKYKISDKKVLQSRNGEVMLEFETFNGDAYIKEN